VDDPRLLSLRVAQEDGSSSVCELPADDRPKDTTAAPSIDLLPGASVIHAFDPRFYCYGNEGALAPGARVTPAYGWSAPARGAFAVTPLTRSPLEPVKRISGEPVTVPAEIETRPKPEWAPPSAPMLEMVRGSDASNERAVTATLRLFNPADTELVIYFRRSLVTYQVDGPNGRIACYPDDEFRHPSLRSFTRLSPHGSITETARLVELCPRGTFGEAGIYEVGAEYEAAENGENLGLDAFTGVLRTTEPVLVRVRRGLVVPPADQAPRAPASPSSRPTTLPGAK
jgi:hypothetical protein